MAVYKTLLKIMNNKKHGLPQIARISFNGNLLIVHPVTREFHWFNLYGDHIGTLEENDENVPYYVWEMMQIKINDGNETQTFIPRFPRGSKYYPIPEPRKGSTPKNIFGRPCLRTYNPSQFIEVENMDDNTIEFAYFRQATFIVNR
jgi:hypothetical protein